MTIKKYAVIGLLITSNCVYAASTIKKAGLAALVASAALIDPASAGYALSIRANNWMMNKPAEYKFEGQLCSSVVGTADLKTQEYFVAGVAAHALGIDTEKYRVSASLVEQDNGGQCTTNLLGVKTCISECYANVSKLTRALFTYVAGSGPDVFDTQETHLLTN